MIAFAAATTEPNRTAEDVVLCTASFANLAFAAHAALVHGVGHECGTAMEFFAQLGFIAASELDVAQAERALAAGG